METEINPERLAAELRADEDVVRSLKLNGDVPMVVRPLDVRFRGVPERIKKFGESLEGKDWILVQIIPLNISEVAIDVKRDQTTEANALRALTIWALQIEARFGIEYDGWGTIATKS